MWDCLIAAAREEGASELLGEYCPTEKNALVKDLYRQLGGVPVAECPTITALISGRNSPSAAGSFARNAATRHDHASRHVASVARVNAAGARTP